MNPYEIEELVRIRLGEMFGTTFGREKLLIGYDSRKRPKIHDFDLVSQDMNMVGEIKSGRNSRGNYLGALADCMFLSKVKAKKKMLILTNKDFYNYFKKNSEGVIAEDIEVIHVCF